MLDPRKKLCKKPRVEGWELGSLPSWLDSNWTPARDGLRMLRQTSEITIGKHAVRGREKAAGAS